jgi:hypothetical protein
MKIGLNIRVEDWHTGMYDSTTFPTSDQPAGRTPPAGLGAIPDGLAQHHIAEALGVTKGAVSQWLSRARIEGPQALRHRKPPGRRSKLSHQQWLQLLALLAPGAEVLD